MEKQNKIAVWLQQIRANFLILAVFLVAIGVSLAYKYQPELKELAFSNALLILIGIVSAHISVNLFNEYSDYISNIDLNTKRTPFSGGSGMLTSGATKSSMVLKVAIITLSIATAIGVYFAITSNALIVFFIAIGFFSIISYTDVLSKIMLGELFAGLSLGSLVVIGSYIAMTATPETPLIQLFPIEVVLISLPPGILTTLLLFLNQFPDSEADKQGGRNHLVISLGKKSASFVYCIGIGLTFAIIITLPIAGISSYWVYLALLSFPIALKSCYTTLKFYKENQKLIPALGGNVITVLSTDLLIAFSIIMAIS